MVFHKAYILLFLLNVSYIQSLTKEQEESGLRVSKFVSWFKEAEIDFFKIKIVQIPGYGFGVKSTHDIKKGERIMKVPFDSILLPSSATHSPAFGHVFDHVRMTSTHKSAVQLLFEKNNPTSFWKPYIDILPTNFSTSLYFTEEEVAYFETARAKEYTRIRNESLSKQYEALILPLLDEYPDIFSPFDKYSLDEFKWALSVIWSRAIKVKSNIDEASLVPLADMFQMVDYTTGEYLQKLETRNTNNSLEFWAIQDIPIGETIFSPYGNNRNFSNTQLIMDYGFVVQNNKNDVILFENPNKEGDSYYHQKKEFLKHMGLNKMEISAGLKEYNDIFAVYRIKHLQPTEFNLIDNVYNNQRVSLRNEKQTVRVMITVVKKLLDQYPSSVDHDNYLLRILDLSQKNRNTRAAVTLRKSEKEILIDLKKKLENARLSLSDESDDNSSHIPKNELHKPKRKIRSEL